MALTITKVTGADYVAGNKRYKVRDVEFDSSYPTGGESLTPADVNLEVIEQVLPHGPAGNSDGTVPTLAWPVRYDHSTEKLQAFAQNSADTQTGVHGLQEADSTENLTDHVVRITFIGW